MVLGHIKIDIIFFIYNKMIYLRLFENFNSNVIDIEEMLKQYLETALWVSELDDFDFNDFDEKSIENAKKDIDKFIVNLIFRGCLEELLNNMSSSSIGHDFWLTRNDHGAGFWDRSLGELGDNVSKISTELGGRDIYEGDDKKIYIE